MVAVSVMHFLIYFSLKNPKKLHYYLLEIRDGKVQLQMKNNKRRGKGLVDAKVNDGNWHHVLVSYKKKKSISIVVDGLKEKVVKAQKNRINRELYIGGLPDNVTDLKKLVSLFIYIYIYVFSF